MNVVATSLPASSEPCEGGWDVRVFAAALFRRRTAPWLQPIVPTGYKLKSAVLQTRMMHARASSSAQICLGLTFIGKVRATLSLLSFVELWMRFQRELAPSAVSSMPIQQKFTGSPKRPAFGAFNCMDIRRLNCATNWLENFA